jgi:signal transduction histidine kinase
MDRLIQDLLDVSRMEAGRFSIEPQPESVRSLMLEAKELLGSMAQAKHIELEHELPDRDATCQRGPPPRAAGVLQPHRQRRQVHGGRRPRHGARTADAAAFAFSVRTPASAYGEDLPRIFDRFWHAGEGGGSGLGLAIAKGIVEAHQGRIWAESSAGAAAPSAFTLPLARSERGRAALPEQPPAADAGASVPRGSPSATP